jgi:imidazolonepropionase-like amidohydrolase
MRVALFIFALLAVVLTVQAQPRKSARPAFAMTNVALIDGTGAPPRPNVTVVISGNRIAAILPTDAQLDARTEKIDKIDGRGKFLIPGLWDMHTHLAYAGDVTCTTLIAHGVTSVRDPGGNLETVDWLRERIREEKLVGPRIFRAGPVVDGSKPGSQDRFVIDTEEDGRQAVRFLKARGVDFIKVHTGVPRAAYFAVLAEAWRQGLAVVGHIPNEVDPAAAIEAGHQSVEHIVTLFEGTVRRKVAAGMPQEQAIAEFTDADVVHLARKMVVRGTWFDPTLVTYWYRSHQWEVRAANDPREQYVTGSMRAFWKGFDPLPDKPEVRRALADSFDRFLAMTRILHQQGVRFLVGTDLPVPLTYPGSTVHEELGWLVKAGLSPMEALVAGTRNGAAAVNQTRELGTIEKGKLADMVLLDADPLADIGNTQKIAAVIADGRLFRREALDAMLAQVAKVAASR